MKNKHRQDKAINIYTHYKISKTTLAYLVDNKLIDNLKIFIMPVKHHSWVLGKENSNYLEQRYNTFKKHFIF